MASEMEKRKEDPEKCGCPFGSVCTEKCMLWNEEMLRCEFLDTLEAVQEGIRWWKEMMVDDGRHEDEDGSPPAAGA